MKAAYIEQTGPPECIIYGELPRPAPTATQVLVRVTAGAVNPIDTYLRNGANYWELPRPYIVGCDLAGVVESVGAQRDSDSSRGIASGAAIRDCWVGKARSPSIARSTSAGSIRPPLAWRIRRLPRSRWSASPRTSACFAKGS